MSARTVSVVFINDNCAYVSGYLTREAITDLRGRPPVWSSMGRAWVTTPRTARDLIAVFERQGRDVAITHADPLPESTGHLW